MASDTCVGTYFLSVGICLVLLDWVGVFCDSVCSLSLLVTWLISSLHGCDVDSMFQLTLLKEVHQLRLPLLSLLLFDMGHVQVLNFDLRDAFKLRDAALSRDFSDVR